MTVEMTVRTPRTQAMVHYIAAVSGILATHDLDLVGFQGRPDGPEVVLEVRFRFAGPQQPLVSALTRRIAGRFPPAFVGFSFTS